MTFANMTPEELTKITGVKIYSFRICCPTSRTCDCCAAEITVGFEGFQPNRKKTGDEVTGSPVICISCVLAQGREAVLMGARKMFGGNLADPETDDENRELWGAMLAQFETGQFDIKLPESMQELARMIDAACMEHSDRSSAFSRSADSFDRRISDLSAGIAEVGGAIADLKSVAAAKLAEVTK